MNTTNDDATVTEVLTEHRIEGIEGMSGLTFDGALVWFVQTATGQLCAIDPDTGKVERKLAGFKVTSGLAFDGEHLWAVTGDRILELDPESGDVLHSIDVPSRGSGLAWAEGALWLGRYAEKELVKLDPKTGAVLKTVSSDRLVTGVSWVDGGLWHGAWEGEDEPGKTAEVRRIDPEDGRVLKRLRTRDEHPVSGLEGDGAGRFWCGDSAGNRLRRVRGS
ncbi:MAG: glutaminyl-peptide cyclotransferase [Planctomycetota bacterium]